MKILMVSTQYPYPKDNGKKIILSSILEYFIEKYRNGNVEYIVVGDSFLEEEPVVKVKLFNKPSVIEQVKNVILYSGFLRKKSIQESVLFSSKIKKRLIEYIESNEFDIVIYDTIRISQFFEGNQFNKTKEFVYLDDLFSVRYEKILKSIKEFPDVDFNVIGNFSKFLPAFAQKLVSFRTLNKFLLEFERRIIKKREIETAKMYSNSLLISQKEANLLNERSNCSTVKSIRPVVINRKDILYNRNFTGEPNFIFLGALNIPHNNVSIYNFIKLNMDKLIEEIPNIKLQIVGKNPSPKLIELAENYPNNIELLGFVDNLDLLFSKACAMIVPLLFGSGVKLKTLEAFSRGLPVIATDYGIEGIDLPLKGECIVENKIENYVHHMKMLTDKQVNEKMSKLSFEFFNSYYSKNAVYAQYDRLFQL
jgi:glycosyltransferase involved in cell wall biosynthesis